MQFLSRWSCNFNTARVNQLRFSCNLSPRFTKHGNFEQQFRYCESAHVLVWFVSLRFFSLQSGFVLFQFCFVLFYKSERPRQMLINVKSMDDKEDVACCCFLSLFTLIAVQIASDKTSRGVPSDSWLSHFNQKSRQNCIKFRTGSKLLRRRGDKIVLKSQLVYTCDIEVATSVQQKLHWVARQKSPV